METGNDGVARGLPARLCAARKSAGLTQKELAAKCGWSDGNSRVSGYETGAREPSLADLDLIALHTGVAVSKLICGDETGGNDWSVAAEFSARLNGALDRKGWPQRGRASKLRALLPFDITEKGVKKWLDGQSIPEMGRLPALAHACGESVGFLLGDANGETCATDHRQNNLRSLVAEHGSIKRLAAEVGSSPSALSQILSGKTQKNMGDRLARKIESALCLGRGWLDRPQVLGGCSQNEKGDPASRAKRRLMEKIDDLDRSGGLTDSLAMAIWLLLDEVIATRGDGQ